jgi:site-specific recombinase
MPQSAWQLLPLLQEAAGLLDESTPRAEKHLWVMRLVHWLRLAPIPPGSLGEQTPPAEQTTAEFGWPEQAADPAEDAQADPVFVHSAVLRTRHLLDTLDADPALRRHCLQLLGDILCGLNVRSALADVGLGPRMGLWSEFFSRLQAKLMPRSPDTSNLGELFMLIFSDERDAVWLRALAHEDADTLRRLQTLVGDVLAAAPRIPRGSRLLDAMTLLSSSVRARGLSTEFQERMSAELNADNPFSQLAAAMDRVRGGFEALRDGAPAGAADASELLRDTQYFRALLERCSASAASVLTHLEEHGVSVNLVYSVDQVQAQIRRIEALLTCLLSQLPGVGTGLAGAGSGTAGTAAIREALVLAAGISQAAHERLSLGALVSSNYALLARKVSQRSADTGEHYITRNPDEYRQMLRMAAGGGAVIGVTSLVKFGLGALALSAFWAGFWAGFNYAVSFVIVQLLHFTVATKQPAMTAPALARKLALIPPSRSAVARRDAAADGPAVQGFVDEVAHLIRSQAAGILGNIALVIPVVVALQMLAWLILGRPLVSEAQSHYAMAHTTLLGPTPLFAAFTGILLFASSLVAGWAENWFVWHRMDSAIRWNPRITALLGKERAARWAQFLRDNISGLSANISLGFMLGLVPAVAAFFGLPLEVRHVTLAMGQLAAAVSTLGVDTLLQPLFWWCVAGIALTGVLNVGVSFFLAFMMALRSQGGAWGRRSQIYGALGQRLRSQPLSFLLPPRLKQAADTKG